jgi:hypothetical protein
VLERKGIEPRVLDLNSIFCERADWAGGVAFFERVADELRCADADVYGFSTISSCYPLTIRLARETKRAFPDRPVIFGGPQASAVDTETLNAFPFVDVVVRGEAETSFPELLDALGNAGRMADVAGIAFRRNGAIVRTRDPEVLPDLNALPTPAFHLWRGMARCESVPLEAGRGCPFGCTFCSTSRFFRRRFRLKAPASVIGQMRGVRDAYGVTRFHLVHDSFTVARAEVVAFCKAMLECGEGFRWTCSARTDRVDEELLALMAEAGCTGIFFGIESGSDEVQRAINKCLDLEQARAAIRCADRQRMRTAVSVIAGFPDETAVDLGATMDFLMDALRCDNVDPQMHLLAPLAGTPIARRFAGMLQWDGMYSSITFQGWQQDPADREMVMAHPEIFPDFYGVPNPHLDRRLLAELREFVTYGVGRFRWLMVALHKYGGGLMAVFRRWQAWREANRPDARRGSEYYSSAGFREDLLEFVAAEYLCAEGPAQHAIGALWEYESKLGRTQLEERDAPAAGGALPRVGPGVRVIELSADCCEAIDCLKSGRSPEGIARQPVIVADRQLAAGGVQLLRLTPLAAALMRLCDGKRTLHEIASVFPTLEAGLEALPAEPACRFALAELARQGLVVLPGGAPA